MSLLFHICYVHRKVKNRSMDVNPRICMQSALFNVDFQIFSSQSVSETCFNVQNTQLLFIMLRIWRCFSNLSATYASFFIRLQSRLWIFYIIVPTNAATIFFLPTFTDLQFNFTSLSSHEMDPSVDILQSLNSVYRSSRGVIITVWSTTIQLLHSQFPRYHHSPCSLWFPGISVVLLFSVRVT